MAHLAPAAQARPAGSLQQALGCIGVAGALQHSICAGVTVKGSAYVLIAAGLPCRASYMQGPAMIRRGAGAMQLKMELS